MKMKTPTTKSERHYNQDKKFWLDRAILGEIAMSVEKIEFTTSFYVEGINTFTLIDGQFHFGENDVFFLWTEKKMLIYYLNYQQCFNITCEDLGDTCVQIGLLYNDTTNCSMIIQRNDDSKEQIPIKAALQFFKPGRGFF